jgi:hypothetical protein
LTILSRKGTFKIDIEVGTMDKIIGLFPKLSFYLTRVGRLLSILHHKEPILNFELPIAALVLNA